MAYRDDVEALRARLGSLQEERARIDDSIAETLGQLRCRVRGSRRRALNSLVRKLAVGLCAPAILLLMADVDCGRRRPGARHSATRADAAMIHAAATMYLAEHTQRHWCECPDVQDLVVGGYLDPAFSGVDAWGKPFRIECRGAALAVRSDGPDGSPGTPDDI